MAPEITVYTRPRCQACERTKRTLADLGVPFRAFDVSEDLVVAQGLVDAGFRAMPVVRVDYPEGDSDYWTGHQPIRLGEIAALLP